MSFGNSTWAGVAGNPNGGPPPENLEVSPTIKDTP